MEKINDGGPAFPVHKVYQDCGIDGNSGPVLTETIHAGMTLRDKFAESVLPEVIRYGYSLGNLTAGRVAEECYQIADAMIKAREVQS